MSETVFERILRLANEQREANKEQKPMSERLEYAVKKHLARVETDENIARLIKRQKDTRC